MFIDLIEDEKLMYKRQREDQKRIHMEKATEIIKAVAGATILTTAIISLYFIGFIFL